MVSCILAFYFAWIGLNQNAGARQPTPPVAVQTPATPDPDELYRRREDLDSARQAAAIFAARAASGQNFEAAWKLARASYWLGTMGPEKDRRAALEAGVSAGELAAKIAPAKPEGYFWQAANMGTLAESFGLSQGLKYRGKIKDALEQVLKMDAPWQQGSADRAIGWWYHKVPGLFGGSEAKAEAHLRQALTYNPNSTATLYFLAEVLIERGKKDEARKVLQQTIDAPLDPDWSPEDRDFKRKAVEKLKAMK